VGLIEFEERRKQMVLTRNMASKKMSDVEQMTLLMSLQRKMAEIKRENEQETTLSKRRRGYEETVGRGYPVFEASATI